MRALCQVWREEGGRAKGFWSVACGGRVEGVSLRGFWMWGSVRVSRAGDRWVAV